MWQGQRRAVRIWYSLKDTVLMLQGHYANLVYPGAIYPSIGTVHKEN